MGYAKTLVAWMEDNRKHLVELLARTQVLLREKEDREEKERREREFLEDILNKSVSLKTYTSRTGTRLNNLQINQSDAGPHTILEQSPNRLNPGYEDRHLSTCIFKFQQVLHFLSQDISDLNAHTPRYKMA